MVSCPEPDSIISQVKDALTPSTVPGPITNLELFPSNGAVVVKWDAPTTDGGEPILGYLIEYRASTGASGTAQQQVASDWTAYESKRVFDRTKLRATSYLITEGTTPSTRIIQIAGLKNDNTLEFRVRAVNIIGSGAEPSLGNNKATPTTESPPTPVTTIRAKVIEEAAVTLTWAEPLAGLPITKYTIEYAQITDKNGDGKITETDVEMGLTDGSVVFKEVATTEREHHITGLTTNIDYAFRIIATNSNGDAAYGTPLILKTGVSLLNLSISIHTQGSTLAVDEASLTWDASRLAGKTITGYKITYKAKTETTETVFNDTNGDGFSDGVAADATSVKINQLAGSTEYTFTVRAYVGTGDNQQVYSVKNTATTPQGRLAKVQNLVLIERTGTEATFEFTPPAVTASDILTKYILKYGDTQEDIKLADLTDVASGNKKVKITGLPAVVQDSPLVFTIVAFGNNLEGIPSNSVQLAPNLSAVSLKATAKHESVILEWVAPLNISDSPITGYDVLYKSKDDTTFSTSKPTETPEPKYSTTIPQYTVPNLTNEKKYTFKILVYTAVSVSDKATAPTVTATPDIEATPPAASTNFIATLEGPDATDPTKRKVKLTWTAPSESGKKSYGSSANLEKYTIEVSSDEGKTWTNPEDIGIKQIQQRHSH